MAYELNWSFNLNQSYIPVNADVLDAARYAFWWFASCMVGGTAWPSAPNPGKWAIYGSSNGVDSFGLDTTDRLGLLGAYDITKFVRNSAGNHTWLVLKSGQQINGSYWYIILDYNTTLDYQVSFYFAKTAPTGGALNARPTSTDEWAANNGSAPIQLIVSGTTTWYHQSFAMTDRGDFYAIWTRNNSTTWDRVYHFQGLTDTYVSDSFPVWAYTGLGYTSNQLNTNGYAVTTRWRDGSTTASPQNYLNLSSGAGTWRPDALSGAYHLQPFHVFCYRTTPLSFYRGRLQDFFITPGSSNPYPRAVLRESGVVKWAPVTNVWVPANAALNLN